jgi:formylglycine-generating enzyme required for sulfatase activity
MKNPIKDNKPTKTFRRVIRGGSWGSGAGVTRVSYRGIDDPTGRRFNLGFRIVRNK